MNILKLQDLSVYYYIKNLFTDASFVNVTNAFEPEDLVIPTIAVENDEITTYSLELGNRSFGKIRTWYIDIYAINRGQRDEFAYRILQEVENKIPVYNYDQGFPPDVTPSKLGVLDPESVQLKIVKVLPELTELMYYRSVVTFTAVYENI